MTTGINGIQPVPLIQPVTEDSGIISKLWKQFFLGLQRLFSQPSYGSKSVNPTYTGFTGVRALASNWITDREFVHFNLEITPTAPLTLASASLSGLPDRPLGPTNLVLNLLNGTVISASYNIVYTSDGLLRLPNLGPTTDHLVISGSFMRAF